VVVLLEQDIIPQFHGVAVRRMHRGCTLVFLILTVACQPSNRQHDAANVANATELVAEEELRIGSVNDPDVGFSRIGGVAVDAEGLIHVLESEDRQIRVYDDQGRHIRSIGRHGAGPGEFRSVTLIGLLHDTLAVGDPSLGRITFFTRTGELLETFPMPPVWLQPAPGVMLMVEPVRFKQDGFATSVTKLMMQAEPPSDSFSVPQVVLDRKGRITDTLRLERWDLSEPRIRVGNVDIRLPSAPPATLLYIDGQEDTYVVDRPVAALADQAAFTVARMAAAGDTVYHEEIRYRPATFSAAVVDSIVARAVRPHLRTQKADSGAIAVGIRQALSLPPYQPPVTQGRVGADGVLWLRLHDDGTDQHRWVLIGPDGRLQGAVSLPRRVTLHWSSGERVWAAVRDEFDVPWLVRYHLRAVNES
jgi:hypothetical protein